MGVWTPRRPTSQTRKRRSAQGNTEDEKAIFGWEVIGEAKKPTAAEGGRLPEEKIQPSLRKQW